MIDVTALVCGVETPSVPHRYGQALRRTDIPPEQRHAVAASASTRRPVVVWNTTIACNLRCKHCYANAASRPLPGELTTDEGKALIDDLAAFKVPALLLSGGEPLMRPDLLDLIRHAGSAGVRTVLSTNGTLINQQVAEQLRAAGLTYVGISLDGLEPTHDRFRGVKGAFRLSLAAFRHLKAVGQKVGLRLTLTRSAVTDLDAIFDLIESEGIDRVCFYHLVPSGRGRSVEALEPAESRAAIDRIIDHTRSAAAAGRRLEILTVDNHCDGPYLYLKLREEGNPRADTVADMLAWNGGGRYSSGVGIGCIDWMGRVHPDQFWMTHTLGNVRDRPFSEIWTDESDPLLAGLRDRLPRLEGRCRDCRFIEWCGGSLRVRAERVTGNPWAPDPACYLTDEEIAAPVAMPVA